MSNCQCFGCVPTRVETKAEEDGPHCSVCFCPMGNAYPCKPCVGPMTDYSICLGCASKYHQVHPSPDKRDPATRKWMITCDRCGEVVHRFNVCFHFQTHDTPPGQIAQVGMAHFKAFADRAKVIQRKNEEERQHGNTRDAAIVID